MGLPAPNPGQRKRTSASFGRPLLLAALGALAVALLGAGSAYAAPPWLPPSELGDTGRGALDPKPEVALDAAGEAVAVWERYDHGVSTIEGALRPPGGAWSAPVVLSKKGQFVEAPQIAVDAAGKAVAVWQGLVARNVMIQSASRLPGGAWSRPVDVSTKGGDSTSPRIAIDTAGRAVAVWQRYTGGTVAQSASLRPGGAWSRPVNLSKKGQEALGPQVAVDAAGEAVAVWRTVNGNVVLQSASRRPRGAWSAPAGVSKKGEEVASPQVAIDAGGEAVVVWERILDGNTHSVRSAVRSPRGAWSRPVGLGRKGRDGTAPEVAIGASGEAVAVWEGRGSHTIIESAARPPGGNWSAPAELSAGGRNALRPQVALDAAGEAVAIWQRYDGKNTIIESAARLPGAAWPPATPVSEAGKYAVEPQIAVTPAGEAVAVWGRFVGSKLIIESSSRPNHP